jgi:proline iminopeptidase
LLDVGDGNRVHWEVSGNPAGQPAVLLHGGPGSGSSPGARRFFDPRAYRIVQFDQRGCGRSTPHASEPHTDLSVNTTEHLLGDLERLRSHLGIDRWLVFGVSWGCTLALAHAERHPDRVRALLLAGVTMTRRSEIDWLYRQVAPLLPEAWARFSDGVPASVRDGDLVEAYHRLLHSPDPLEREKAARDWHDWEAASLSVDPAATLPPGWADPDFRLARARIVTHYFRHAAWLDEGALLRGASALAAIPGVMVQGRLDLQGPLTTAWELARAWPRADLVIVDGAGHSARDAGMTEAIVAATDRFAEGG